jgi:hypothetical protein
LYVKSILDEPDTRADDDLRHADDLIGGKSTVMAQAALALRHKDPEA